MKRSAPLKRKKPIWAYKKTLKSKGKNYAKPEKPKATLRRISAKREREMKRYYELHKEFLETHIVCGICLALGVKKPRLSTEVHHSRGRAGRLLCDTRFWVPSCRSHREFPHENPAQARELGLLSSAAEWNVWPGEN